MLESEQEALTLVRRCWRAGLVLASPSGGVVPYEMAQKLTAKGIIVGLFALFDTYIGSPEKARSTAAQLVSAIEAR